MLMTFTTKELMRLLEYIPKETSPDLHEKMLGSFVASRYYDAIYTGSPKSRAEHKDCEEQFTASLTEDEFNAWQKYINDVIGDMDE